MVYRQAPGLQAAGAEKVPRKGQDKARVSFGRRAKGVLQRARRVPQGALGEEEVRKAYDGNTRNSVRVPHTRRVRAVEGMEEEQGERGPGGHRREEEGGGFSVRCGEGGDNIPALLRPGIF